MRIEPASARYRVEETESLLRITIPARRAGQWVSWFGIAWVAGVLTILGSTFERRAGPPQAIAFGSLLFVIGLVALFAAAPLVWMYCGREEITIAGRTLLRKLKAGPLRAQRVYALGEARKFSISARNATACSLQLQPLIPLGVGRGSIQFELGGETRYLGSALDETEAAHVLARIAAHVSARADGSDALGRSAAEVEPRAGSKKELHIMLRPWRKAALAMLAFSGVGALFGWISKGALEPGGLWGSCGYGLLALAWLGFVREEITIREGLLVRRIGAGFLRRKQVYLLEQARNVRLALVPTGLPRFFSRDGMLGGSVWFDNGERLARLGAGLGDLEAGELVSRLSPFIIRA